jgi:hypothetical protein
MSLKIRKHATHCKDSAWNAASLQLLVYIMPNATHSLVKRLSCCALTGGKTTYLVSHLTACCTLGLGNFFENGRWHIIFKFKEKLNRFKFTIISHFPLKQKMFVLLCTTSDSKATPDPLQGNKIHFYSSIIQILMDYLLRRYNPVVYRPIAIWWLCKQRLFLGNACNTNTCNNRRTVISMWSTPRCYE